MTRYLVLAFFLFACGNAPTGSGAGGLCQAGDGGCGSCDDSVPCTTDLCMPGGCVHLDNDTDLDGTNDCEDCQMFDALSHPGATETCDTVDNDCDESTDEDTAMMLWADCDGDGWATATAVTFVGCVAPGVEETGCSTMNEAWTSREPIDGVDFDCADTDARAHSTETSYFTTPIVGATDPDFDFDFDCDFVETEQSMGMACSVGGCR